MAKKLGIKVKKASTKGAEIERKTAESTIKVKVDFGKRKKYKIDTSLEFLNHMIEHIAWNCGFNVDVSYKAKSYKLTHVICEDTGIVVGRALREVLLKRMEKGVSGRGSNIDDIESKDVGIIDEAGALVAVSFEGRPSFNMVNLNREVPAEQFVFGKVEDMNAADLDDFISGMALGLMGTINVYFLSGDDPHHMWEAVFRGIGSALRKVFEENEYRKGTIAGVKATLE